MTIETVTYNDSNNTPYNIGADFLNMTTENIREELALGRMPMINVCMNLTSDFNKSSVIRANNAFLGQEVIIVGKKRFDRRGTVGTHQYENIKHSEEIEPVLEYLRENGYTIFAVDNTPAFNPVAVYDVEIPEKVAFIYGEEKLGLSEEIVAQCDKSVYIPQYGSVRSLNVSQAAAVMMSEYSRTHRR